MVQPDGKVLMGGYFTQLSPFGVSPVAANFIARLNHDGSADSGFQAQANGIVRAMALEPNGQILVGGNFTSMGNGTTSAVRNSIARLNADGSLDANFNPNANGVVYAVAVQGDGKVLIGGAFTSVGGTTRNHIARLNSDGTLDTTFDPNADKTVLSLAVQPNGQILVGGGFATLTPNGASSAIARSCMARLNSDGSVDTSFDPEPNGSVMAILVLPNGQIVMGGQFVTVQPNGASTTNQVDFVARLNSDGSLDNTYIINPLSYVSALALQPDGKLLIGGIFTSVFPITALSASAVSYVARVNPNGTLDSSFVPQPNQAINSIAVQTDGNVILGGFFTALNPLDSSTSVTRNYIARVSTYGVPDATFAPDTSGTVYASAPLSNGQFLVGGTFLSVGGLSQSFFARLNADGTLDTTFAPTFNGPVQAITVQSDGKYLVGGSFSEVDGLVRNYMVRLNTDGTIDGAFNPNPNANITTIAVQSDGRILISGGFSALDSQRLGRRSYAVNYFARINADGSLDTTFNPSPSGGVYAIAFQSDGRMMVAGGFTTIAGRHPQLRRAPAPDTAPSTQRRSTPSPTPPSTPSQIQSDNKVLIGGSFTGVIPQTGKTGTATTTTTSYGYTITAARPPGTNATVPIYINHLARLNTDGTLDTTFLPDPSSDVLALALQSSGDILVGGTFTSFAQNGAVDRHHPQPRRPRPHGRLPRHELRPERERPGQRDDPPLQRQHPADGRLHDHPAGRLLHPHLRQPRGDRHVRRRAGAHVLGGRHHRGQRPGERPGRAAQRPVRGRRPVRRPRRRTGGQRRAVQPGRHAGHDLQRGRRRPRERDHGRAPRRGNADPFQLGRLARAEWHGPPLLLRLDKRRGRVLGPAGRRQDHRRRTLLGLQRRHQLPEPHSPQCRWLRGHHIHPDPERHRKRDRHPARRQDRDRRRLLHHRWHERAVPRAPEHRRHAGHDLRPAAEPPDPQPRPPAERPDPGRRRLHDADADRRDLDGGLQLPGQDQHGRLDRQDVQPRP
jgi:uncharacterized delta-60 repeat protein